MLRECWLDEEQKMRAYLNSLGEEAFNQTVHYKTTKGAPFGNTLWNLLAHMVNHGTQFRAEAGIALTAFGQSPGDLDLLLYFREKMT